MDSIYLDNYSEFAARAKSYASQFSPCAILDSCEIGPQLNKGFYKLIIGFGGNPIVSSNTNKLDSLYSAWESNKTWLFGVLGYNLKNEIEKLSSLNNTAFNWPELSFFTPETVIKVSWENELEILGENAEAIFNSILNYSGKNQNSISCLSELKVDFDKENHERAVNTIKEEIRNGNVYELNLCSRFLYDKIKVSEPFQLFSELLKISPAPFSGYFSIDNKFVISASPERYMSKNKNILISQPIKGTRPRSQNGSEDEAYKNDLSSNVKDQAENVMIVDLVRNDMARVARAGSVKVEELFGVYSYSHVHQLVSSVSSEIDESVNWKDVLKATFPMGSMTGAPKIAAMQWIEKFELSNREWYSGALGYIDPNGNMDFNVLIRSIFYDSSLEKLAYYAGGAITIDSEPEEEYREMMVKAKAIHSLLTHYF